jgi:phosphoglycolate phosphatase
MPAHIVWDWNGTLLDDIQPCVDAINRMLEVRQLPGIDRQQYRDIFDFPVKGYYRRLGFDLNNEDWDSMAKEFHKHYGQLAAEAGLRAGTADTLAAIRDRGITMSILSACEITILERMLLERGIRHYFDHVFGLDNLYASSKLDQGRRLIEALSLPPDDILLVGDTNHDHEVAEQLGLKCVLLDGGHQAEHRLATSDRIQNLGAILDRLD